MTMRIHYTTADALNVSVFNGSDMIPDEYAVTDDEMPLADGHQRLVVEDAGNLEAFVIDGPLGELINIGHAIVNSAVSAIRIRRIG